MDERLEELNTGKGKVSAQLVRIKKISVENFRFFKDKIDLNFENKNVLIYGENGSGKSSIYRAMEYLSKEKFNSLITDRNIFSKENPLIEFLFSNGKELLLNKDLDKIPEDLHFLSGLNIFVPMLDYKKLLKLHFNSKPNGNKINLFELFIELFKDYPIDNGRKLSEEKDLNILLKELEKIINTILRDDINSFIKFFDSDFELEKCNSSIPYIDNIAMPTIHLDIDYKEQPIPDYHNFLNEARLTALAISIYFASIKKLYDSIDKESLKILILDDLLISLDMSNRLKLLDLLKKEFSEFQIFFFTHDKELYEIYKDKIDWKKFEFFVDTHDEYPKPIIKESKSDLQRAKVFYSKKDYDCCALLLRKEFERKLKSFVPLKEQRDKNCEDLDLSKLVAKAISLSNGEIKEILGKLQSDRKHILNPLSHSDPRDIYPEELKSAMTDLEKLIERMK
jgi:energy-coupling factor transporter ATP-binding protein EcfA2